MASRTERSPTGVVSTRIPSAAMARWKPKLAMTVATTVSWWRRPRARRSRAAMARMWSPSTRPPRSSTATRRSASPSKASPAAAPRSTTSDRSASGWVEPHPALMLVPEGAAPISRLSTLAPSRLSTHGAASVAAPLPQSTTTVSPSSRRPSSTERRWVSYSRRAAPAGQQGVELGLEAGLHIVGQLAAAPAEELDAVVGERVVAGRQHRRRAVPGLAQIGRAGGGHDPGQDDVAALGGQAGGQGRLQHRARPARVAGHHERPVGAQDAGRRPPEGQRQLRRQFDVGQAPDPVGAEPEHPAIRD